MADESGGSSGGSDFMSDGQQVTLLTAQALASLISVFGSASVLVIVLQSKRRQPQGIATSGRMGGRGGQQRTALYHRILFGLSVYDIIFSLNFAVAPYLQPPAERLLGAAGTVASCSASGFFHMSGIATVLYNLNLSFFYYQTIVLGMSEEKLIQRFELWMHGVPFVFWVAFGAVNVGRENFNPWETVRLCSIKPYPASTCALDRELSDCERGSHAMKTGYMMVAVIALSSLLSIVLTIRVYVSVKQTFAASRKHLVFSSTTAARSKEDAASNALPETPFPREKIGALAAALRRKQEEWQAKTGTGAISDSVTLEPVASAGAGSCSTVPNATSTPDYSYHKDEEGSNSVSASSRPVVVVSESAIPSRTRTTSQESIYPPARPKGSTTDRQAERLRQVMVQAILYCSFFTGAVVFMMVMMIVEDVAMIPRSDLGQPGWFLLILVETVAVALCGFFQFCIYIRPWYLRWRRAGFTVLESLQSIYQGHTAPTHPRVRSSTQSHKNARCSDTSCASATTSARVRNNSRNQPDVTEVTPSSASRMPQDSDDTRQQQDLDEDVDYIPPKEQFLSAKEATEVEGPTFADEEGEKCFPDE